MPFQQSLEKELCVISFMPHDMTLHHRLCFPCTVEQQEIKLKLRIVLYCVVLCAWDEKCCSEELPNALYDLFMLSGMTR